jgi:preprotein translocase subunit SecG
MIDVLLYIVFVIAAMVLIVVILLQEGRGGGFGQALGEHGQQTFGVAAQGIHKFTMWVAIVFLAAAVTLHWRGRSVGDRSVFDTTITPADPTQQSQPK